VTPFIFSSSQNGSTLRAQVTSSLELCFGSCTLEVGEPRHSQGAQLLVNGFATFTAIPTLFAVDMVEYREIRSPEQLNKDMVAYMVPWFSAAAFLALVQRPSGVSITNLGLHPRDIVAVFANETWGGFWCCCSTSEIELFPRLHVLRRILMAAFLLH
jgi:hypothetical protein